MTPTPPRRPERLPSLQVFRGVAALLVTVFHTTVVINNYFNVPFLGDYFLMGNAGVDFFFVLSGFIICYANLDAFGQPGRVAGYLEKRLVRIFPIYWIITLAILPVYFFQPHFGQGDETHGAVILGSLFLVPMTRAPVLVAGWTLVHEMLFYLVFALLIGFRGRRVWIVAGAWALAVGVNALAAFSHPVTWNHPVVDVLLWPQNLEFMLGCGAALLVSRMDRTRPRRAVWGWGLALGLVGFALGGFLPDGMLDLKLGEHSVWFGGLSVLIVVAATSLDISADPAGGWHQLGAWRAMLFLGDASYSLYLVHGPLLSVSFKVMRSTGIVAKVGLLAAAGVALGLTVACACGFHQWVEKPLLRRCRRAVVAS